MTEKHSSKSKQSGSDPHKRDKGVVVVLKAGISVKFHGLEKQKRQGVERQSMFNSLLGDSSSLSAELIAHPQVQRLEISQGEKDTITVVYRGGRPTAFWDSNLRAHADLSQVEPPNNRITPTASQKFSWGKDKMEVSLDITGSDETLGVVRHELRFSQSKELLPFGEAVFKVLFCGPLCHASSGFPYQEIVGKGCLISARTYLGDSKEPLSEVLIDPHGVEEVATSEFAAPSGYQPLDALLKSPKVRKPHAEPSEQAKDTLAASVRFALEGKPGRATQALEIDEKLTPDCLGSTRFGSMAATLHQDFFDNVSNTVNTVAPLLGPTTIAGGAWTVPWLSSLSAINTASSTAPGSGIFCFLRDPRQLSTMPGGPSGGAGLLDRLAFQNLTERNGDGLTRTQREARDGTLAATLAGWGVGAPIDAALTNANGDLNQLTPDQQRTVVEAYENMELGVFTIGGLPATMGPFSFGSVTLGPIVIGRPPLQVIIGPITTPSLMAVSITGIGGTVDFSGLGGGPLLTTASIGNSGNVVLGVALPTINLAATISRSLTAWGWGIALGGTAAFCFAFPLMCPLAIVVATLLAFVTNNVTSVMANATGVNVTLDVQYRFDASSGRVEPFVSVVSSTGSVNVTTTWVTPNIIGNAFDSMVAGLGNLFNAWLPMLADQAAKMVEQTLRDQGLHLPVAGRQTGLKGVAGSASSSRGALLQLSVDVAPIDNVASQPFITQVIPRDGLERQLMEAHLIMRRDLNPPPAAPAPGPGAALTIASYLGLGLSQNVLNYYLFHQWTVGRFNVDVTSPSVINAILGAAPPNLFQRTPIRVHLWPATPPRVETTPSETGSHRRPLLVYFDDVRACFEIPNGHGTDNREGFSGHWELSFNVKTTGTVQLNWPWVFNLLVDGQRSRLLPSDQRSWEWVDPNIPDVMGRIRPNDLANMVDLLDNVFLRPLAASAILPPSNPANWGRPLVATQELMFPALAAGPLGEQRLYLELLERRKALYVLPALDTDLLQLIDGSGAPALNTMLQLLGTAPAGSTIGLRTMTCPQGTALRDFVLPLTGLPVGP